MIEGFLYVLYAALIVSSLCAIFFSVKSRRSLDARVRGISQAKMNISMGFMLIVLAIIQMFMFSGSTVRVVVGALFMVLGAFNIFAGIRNLGIFSRRNPE
ncbi:YtpI-like protein [Fontibacillus phaseoli]|uniref:YtpI-like protein n=1 Tax=Fontibacillus phaseoli TaxID=1416533 RepID=A0A369B706_9BACL|nr:YtpI family protein [Fontibacillus phaseoli]RCX17299.1 YtpI-like protein [Fontibacillus phaseoli]